MTETERSSRQTGFKQFIKRLRRKTFGRRTVRAKESTKARPRREKEGFFQKFCQGRGLDIGYGGDLLAQNCKGWEIEQGDAQYLKGLRDRVFDFVYSSHTLEHMVDPVVSLQNWWRVVKPGGFMILYIPHRDLYEKKQTLPSRWNSDHKRFFLIDANVPPDTVGILPLIERSLTRYEMVYAKECSEGHDITDPYFHSNGEYSIEVVLKKI